MFVNFAAILGHGLFPILDERIIRRIHTDELCQRMALGRNFQRHDLGTVAQAGLEPFFQLGQGRLAGRPLGSEGERLAPAGSVPVAGHGFDEDRDLHGGNLQVVYVILPVFYRREPIPSSFTCAGPRASQQALFDEMTAFPFGEHDDLLDAAAAGTAYLLNRPEPRVWCL